MNGPRLSAVVVRQHPTRGWVIAVVAKRTYSVLGSQCHVSPEQVPIVEEPQLDGDDHLVHDSDLLVHRRSADIIVSGTARSASPRPSFDARVEIGAFVRRLRVFGDRRLERTAGGQLSFTPPAPVAEVPLTWENAYGGVDQAALDELGDPFVEAASQMGHPAGPRQSLFAYPRNPFGRGYLIEPTPAAIERCRLPAIEDPDQLLTPESVVRNDPRLWPTAPLPAATGWLGYTTFPRSLQVGLPPRLYLYDGIPPARFPEVALGVLRPRTLDPTCPINQRIDLGAAQCSALGMRADTLALAAEVRLVNLHPSHPDWHFRLPERAPRLVFSLPAAPPADLEAHIRTVLIEPDADRISLVWVGEAELDLPLFPEQLRRVEHAVLWE